MKKETEVFILNAEEKEMLKTILNNIISNTKKDRKEVIFETFICETHFFFSPQGVKNLKKMAKILV